MNIVLLSRIRLAAVLLALIVGLQIVAGCDSGSTETAAKDAIANTPHPQGRVLTANQGANSVSLIDVATNAAYGTVPTGEQPHHVAASPDGKEFWVTLYKENRLQVFDAQTLKEIASVDVGGSNDDIVFDPTGKRVFTSLGANNAVAEVDAVQKKMVRKIDVGQTPHGMRVTPDGTLLLVTNTADNTVSLVDLTAAAQATTTVKTGQDPFEIVLSADGGTAYVSNFLGNSITVIDLKTRKVVNPAIKSGRQPAMLALAGDGAQKLLAVANTASADLWLIDPTTRKLSLRIPVGQGAHGVVMAPNGDLYVTNATDNTVSVVSPAQGKVVTTIAVANNPNGLAYLPNSSP